MNRATDAESLERNVFRSFWQDGLLDCFAGIGLLGLGVAWVTGHAALGAAIPALLVPIWPLVRKRVTAPRIGEVRFTPARRDKEGRKFTHVGLTLGVGLFAATVFFLLRSGRADISVLRSWIAALPAALLGLMSLVTALLWSLRRFLAYAALLVLGGVSVVLLDVHPGWGFLAPGVLVSLVGALLLTRFIRRHPVLEETS